MLYETHYTHIIKYVKVFVKQNCLVMMYALSLGIRMHNGTDEYSLPSFYMQDMVPDAEDNANIIAFVGLSL